MVVRGGIWGLLALALTGCAQQPVTTASSVNAEPAAMADAKVERAVAIQALPAKQPIKIDNPYGDVRLRFGGYESKLEWRTVAQNGTADSKISVSGDSDGAFVVRARLPEGVTLAAAQRVDITAYVPQDHDVEVVTERGLIEARGLHANLKARSTAGDITFRGIKGLVDVETASGSIEGQIDAAPGNSQQRVATSTGAIILGLVEGLNATLNLATSGVFATEFSLAIDPQPGQEPNNTAHAVIGKPESNIEVVSKRGEIRLLRRMQFRPA